MNSFFPSFRQDHMLRTDSTYSFCMAVALLVSMLILLFAPSNNVLAQATNPTISLTRPSVFASNRLDLLRTPDPHIAILNSQYTAEKVTGGAVKVKDAVYYWELLLLGLNVPYRVIEDRDLTRGVSRDIQILILPHAEAMSERQRSQIRRYVDRGGGLLASGRTGMFDERGRPTGDTFFGEVFGAEYITNLPEQSTGILQSLGGDHPHTFGQPMGFRLNLAPQIPTTGARPVSSTGIGRPFTYSPIHGTVDPFTDVTFIVYGKFGNGRVTWLRFNPQDVSRESNQQAEYQAFIVNTLAYTAQIPMAGIRAWPNGQQSATVLAALPLIGYSTDFAPGMNRISEALEAAGGTGTFFFTSKEAVLFPDLLRRIDRIGEVAICADTDDLLKKEALGTQIQRLEIARNDLASFTDQPILGLYPPGGFYDSNTAQAMRDVGLRYLLQATAYTSATPSLLDWYNDADYRDPMFSDASTANVASETPRRRRVSSENILTIPMTGRDDYTILSILNLGAQPAAQFAAYRDDLIGVHRGGGLYVLPYHFELQGLTTERASVLRQIVEFAQRQQSWVTNFRDVHNWWIQREQLGIQIAAVSDNSMTIEIINAGNQLVSGVSVDLRLSEPVRSINVDETNARTRLASDGQAVVLIVPSVRSGTNRITVSFNRR